MTETVVSVEWLADHLGDEDVRVVDVRDEWEFDGIGHVPGAANVPFDEFRSAGQASERDADGASDESGDEPRTGDEGMLPGAAVWERLLGEIGVERDDLLVAYDDTRGVFAARFLVTAELYGHPTERLRLLDGDYSAWSRGREVSRETPTFEPGEYDARRSGASPLVGFEAVEAAVGSETVIVDTREAWEYEEGHVPGAVRLDWRELVDDDSRGLKPREEMEAILESRGITPGKRVLLYCNTARRISHTYLALRHLGYENIAFYEGSLTEWKRRGGELETGDGATPEGSRPTETDGSGDSAERSQRKSEISASPETQRVSEDSTGSRGSPNSGDGEASEDASGSRAEPDDGDGESDPEASAAGDDSETGERRE